MAQQGFFVVHDTPSLAMRGGHARIVKVVWCSAYHSPIAESRSHYTPLYRAEKPDGERTPLSQHHFRFVLLRGNCASPLDHP